MNTLRVSSVPFGRTYTTNYGLEDDNTKRHDNDSEGFLPDSISGLKKVPVALMIAMLPNVTEAKIPEDFYEPEITTEVVQKSSYNNLPENVYIVSPEMLTQSNSTPWKSWGIFKLEKIRMDIPAKMGNKSARLIFASSPKYENTNVVNAVYIPLIDAITSNSVMDHPPEVKELIYHNLGDGKDFCSVLTVGTVFGESGKYLGHMTTEKRIDDATAQKIIDLIADKSTWENATRITFRETNSPSLATSVLTD